MNKVEVNNIAELTFYLGQQNLTFDYLQPFAFSNITFKFSLGSNFSELLNLQHSNGSDSQAKTFNSIQHYIFDNCCFQEEIIIEDTFGKKLTFQNKCIINGVDFSDATFKSNIRFYECSFSKKCSFNNTKFNDLIDFWNSTFHIPILFFKTDFLSTTVFSACHFRENVLFTYSLFKEKAIFRGTTFDKGLDISLAINSGEYNFFNVTLNNFRSKKHSGEVDYTDMISNDTIPTINKKETFRIIKQHFESNGDDLEYVKYLRLEKKPIFEIVSQNLVETKPVKFWNYVHYIFDLFSLLLNKVSNNNRNSYLLGICFTIIIGLFFFTLSVLSLPDYCLQLNPLEWNMDDFWKFYLTFMNPTHDVKLFDNLSPNGWTYFWQTWGRIFVGYGIYQTVQAFRKLK
jgi:hypothetical protein